MSQSTRKTSWKSNDEVFAAFVSEKAEVDTMLTQLQALSDDHFGLAPDEVTWATSASWPTTPSRASRPLLYQPDSAPEPARAGHHRADPRGAPSATAGAAHAAVPGGVGEAARAVQRAVRAIAIGVPGLFPRKYSWRLPVQGRRAKPQPARSGGSTCGRKYRRGLIGCADDRIVSAYVSHNQIGPAELAELIGGVAGQLGRIGSEPEQLAEAVPAAPVRCSIQPDHLVCLVCGKPQKVLKRHLGAAHQLTATAYREQFGLKHDYPMAAPDYAQQRRELALKIGLGRPRKPARRRRKSSGRQETSQRDQVEITETSS